MNIEDYQVARFLNEDWQQWLVSNLAREVPVKSLANTMLEHGMFEAASALMSEFKIKYTLPYIDLSRNKIQLDDKTVNIIFACQAPYVVVIDDFLSELECQALIEVSDNKFNEARVIDPSTGEFVQHQARTSMNTTFHVGENDIVKVVEQRIADLLHWPVENGEGLQVLRYKVGGEYKPHFDFFNKDTAGGQKSMKVGGQRVGTFLMYLSEVEGGGSTRFPNMNFEVRPKTGMALYFANVQISGIPEERSLHSSVPVSDGIKYIATKWLREQKYG